MVVSDNKSPTYKFVILRSILSITKGHLGAVVGQTDDHVPFPLGLVAFYWLITILTANQHLLHPSK